MANDVLEYQMLIFILKGKVSNFFHRWENHQLMICMCWIVN